MDDLRLGIRGTSMVGCQLMIPPTTTPVLAHWTTIDSWSPGAAITPCRPVSAALELGLVQRVNVITTYTPGAPRNSRSRIMRVKAVCVLHILIKLSGAIATSLQAETCVWLFPLAVLEGVEPLDRETKLGGWEGIFQGLIPGRSGSCRQLGRGDEDGRTRHSHKPQARSSHTLSTATFVWRTLNVWR